MITCEQLETITEGIDEFNQLAFSDEERNQPWYLEHCQRMVTEEAITERKEAKSDVEYLDSLVDSVVVASQSAVCPNISDDEKLAAYALVLHALQEGCNKGYKMFDACVKVNANNLTKFPLLSEVKDYYGDVWEEAACDYIESQGRYKGVTCSVLKNKEGKDVVRFRDEKKKVVKWVGYVDVDLGDCV